MSSVTDWLTSIGTISAVVISLSYAIFGDLAKKKRRRGRMVRSLCSLSEELYHEIETARQNEPLKAITELKTYKPLKIYQSVIRFSADISDEDILMLGENILESFEDYFQDQSEEHKTFCLNLIAQIKALK